MKNKRIMALLLALVLALSAVPALAADYSGSSSGNVNTTGDDSLTGDYAVLDTHVFTVDANTTLDGKTYTLTVQNGADLVIKGSVKDMKIRLNEGAGLMIYEGASFEAVKIDKDEGATVTFYKKKADSSTDYETTDSFVSKVTADGKELAKKAGDSGAVHSGQVTDKDDVEVVLTPAALPDGAKLKLYDGSKFIEGKSDAPNTFVFDADFKKTYTVYVSIGDDEHIDILTKDAVVLYDEASAQNVVSKNTSEKAEFIVGQSKKLFNVTPLAGFEVKEAKVESEYEEHLLVDVNGNVTAKKALGKKNVKFTFTIAKPDGNDMTREITVDNLEIDAPLSLPSKLSVYVNQRTKLFDVNLPDSYGYTLVDVKSNNADVLTNADDPGYITAKASMRSKDVVFTLTFRSKTNAEAEFTTTHTVRLSASYYRPSYPITVTLPKLYIAVGESVQAAVPPYESISTTSSGNPNVAMITGSGRVFGRSVGTTTLYVYTQGGGYGSVQVMVTPANAIVSGETSLTAGSTTQLYVYGDAIAYCNSSNEGILHVTSSGLVTATGTGTATVFVSTAGGRGGSITIKVTEKPLTLSGPSSMKVGETGYVTLSNGYLFSVKSSNSSVIRVYDSGYMTAVGAGTATITATDIYGRVGTKTIRVTGASTSDAIALRVGETKQLTLSGSTISGAYSLDTSVATVTARGKVTAVGKGSTTIYLFNNNGTAGTAKITVTGSGSTVPDDDVRLRSMKVAQTMTLKITGKKIIGASLEEDNGTLTVTNSGKVTGVKAGTDTVYIITDDNRVYRYEFTIKSRSGVVDVPKGTSLALRKSASSSSTRLAKLRDGQKVTITGTKGNYYEVEVTLSGRTYTGYASKRYVDK